MPLNVDTNSIVNIYSSKILARFPTPKPKFAFSVS